MADDWQILADEDVKPPAPKVDPILNKWAGEDEEDDIKDSWDADDDEKKDEEKNDQPAPVKPKKMLNQKIAEKEKQKAELEEKKRKEREEELAKMDPAERRRLEKLQEEEDAKLALDTLGLGSVTSSDSFPKNPQTEEEFAEFADAIVKKVRELRESDKYVDFVDGLVTKLCNGLSSTSIKKINGNLSNLQLAQQKIEKGDKPKKKAAGKVKAKIRIEGDDDYNSRVGAFEADDYDDFM